MGGADLMTQRYNSIKRVGLTNLGTKRLNFRNSLKEGYE